MTDVERLIEELTSRPEAEGLMRQRGIGETAAERAEALLAVSEELGIESGVGPAELAGYLEEMEASRRASADRIAEDIAKLDDEALGSVAGGLKQMRTGRNRECGKKADAQWSCLINDKCTFAWHDWRN